jgi:hypothetical protein
VEYLHVLFFGEVIFDLLSLSSSIAECIIVGTLIHCDTFSFVLSIIIGAGISNAVAAEEMKSKSDSNTIDSSKTACT